MRSAVIAVVLSLGVAFVPAQEMRQQPAVDTATANAVLEAAKATHPKFSHELQDARANDKLIKNMRFIRGVPGHDRGPAFAAAAGVITIDLNYLDTPKRNFSDNRMVVVTYHEIGHLHYFEEVPRDQWTPDHSEQAAFEYSLKKTKELAEKGDCGPLATGVYFMKQRSMGTNLEDPHVRALKRIVTEPMYAGYVKYVAETPACQNIDVGLSKP
jgi:hypothetical protein